MRAAPVVAPFRLLALVSLLAATLAASPGGDAQARRVSLIVTGAQVVTMNPGREVLSPGAVAVDGQRIVAVDRPEAIAARFTAP
ncbi:MAG: hypothetical protein EHM24_18435, partial [Acidobacteria bacterium]